MGLSGKTYLFTESEKDQWANLFAYIGSEENVRLKFAIDKIGGNLNDIVITYGDFGTRRPGKAFLADLQGRGKKLEAEPDTPGIGGTSGPSSPGGEKPDTPAQPVSPGGLGGRRRGRFW